MLVNVHNPKVEQITTHDVGTEHEFHTVQLTESRIDNGGRVDLFIRSDWSDWDALVAEVAEYRQTTAVRALATDDDAIVQTVCEGCGLDIEGSYNGAMGTWLDRGGNRHCDNSDNFHWPVNA